MTSPELKALLKLSTVPRWAIVDMSRQQSVAEHSYRVWAIAAELYKVLYPAPHNQVDEMATARWALVHDVEEAFMGDTPSTAKEILERVAPGVGQKWVDAIIQKEVPGVAAFARGVKGSPPGHVVKIADILEAILFTFDYAVNAGEKVRVLNFLYAQLGAAWRKAQADMITADWLGAVDFRNQLLAAEPAVARIEVDYP
jgi:5'-deoxynucleotidase YfbR-like HD superfamily hydrolase